MGGFGSGRPGGYGRDTVESCRSIDVNRLNREGCLEPGWCGIQEWKRDGERVAAISVRAEGGRMVLGYSHRLKGGEWQDVEEPVAIVRVPCRYGGTRPYFICPGVVDGLVCGRRVVKLYGPGRYFLCRHCYGLAYSSQSEGAWDRAIRRSDKIRLRLGGRPGLVDPFPEKPKGMWWRTYERLQERAFDAQDRANEAFIFRTHRIVARHERSKDKRSFWT